MLDAPTCARRAPHIWSVLQAAAASATDPLDDSASLGAPSPLPTPPAPLAAAAAHHEAPSPPAPLSSAVLLLGDATPATPPALPASSSSPGAQQSAAAAQGNAASSATSSNEAVAPSASTTNGARSESTKSELTLAAMREGTATTSSSSGRATNPSAAVASLVLSRTVSPFAFAASTSAPIFATAEAHAQAAPAPPPAPRKPWQSPAPPLPPRPPSRTTATQTAPLALPTRAGTPTAAGSRHSEGESAVVTVFSGEGRSSSPSTSTAQPRPSLAGGPPPSPPSSPGSGGSGGLLFVRPVSETGLSEEVGVEEGWRASALARGPQTSDSSRSRSQSRPATPRAEAPVSARSSGVAEEPEAVVVARDGGQAPGSEVQLQRAPPPPAGLALQASLAPPPWAQRAAAPEGGLGGSGSAPQPSGHGFRPFDGDWGVTVGRSGVGVGDPREGPSLASLHLTRLRPPRRPLPASSSGAASGSSSGGQSGPRSSEDGSGGRWRVRSVGGGGAAEPGGGDGVTWPLPRPLVLELPPMDQPVGVMSTPQLAGRGAITGSGLVSPNATAEQQQQQQLLLPATAQALQQPQHCPRPVGGDTAPHDGAPAPLRTPHRSGSFPAQPASPLYPPHRIAVQGDSSSRGSSAIMPPASPRGGGAAAASRRSSFASQPGSGVAHLLPAWPELQSHTPAFSHEAPLERYDFLLSNANSVANNGSGGTAGTGSSGMGGLAGGSGGGVGGHAGSGGGLSGAYTLPPSSPMQQRPVSRQAFAAAASSAVLAMGPAGSGAVPPPSPGRLRGPPPPSPLLRQEMISRSQTLFTRESPGDQPADALSAPLFTLGGDGGGGMSLETTAEARGLQLPHTVSLGWASAMHCRQTCRHLCVPYPSSPQQRRSLSCLCSCSCRTVPTRSTCWARCASTHRRWWAQRARAPPPAPT